MELSLVELLASESLAPFGRPASPFIGKGKARVTREREKSEEEEATSGATSSFISLMWALSVL
jgi:hypothetical protein